MVDNHLLEEFKTILAQRQESYDTPAVEQEARKALRGVAIDCRDAMNKIDHDRLAVASPARRQGSRHR